MNTNELPVPPSEDSFFGVFGFDNLMHDARDYAIVYFSIVITKDIRTASGALKRGDTFEQCVFDFSDQTFTFETYDYQCPADEDGCAPAVKRITINQSELAIFLAW